MSGVKEREPAPKTEGRGRRWGVDRGACEFLFYCLTLLKQNKTKQKTNEVEILQLESKTTNIKHSLEGLNKGLH